jgi:hypothetical protein
MRHFRRRAWGHSPRCELVSARSETGERERSTIGTGDCDPHSIDGDDGLHRRDGRLVRGARFWDGAGQFLRDNVLVQAQRIPLMVAMGVTAVVTVGAFTTIVLKRRGVDGVEIIDRASRWMLPMVLLPLLPAFWYRTYGNSLTLSIYLTAFVLLLEWTTRVSANAWWPFDSVAGAWRRWTQSNGLAGWIERRGPLAAVLGAVAIYVVWASVWTIAAHHKFQTEGYDLGQYDNLFWNTLHGDWLRCYPLDLTENWHGLRNHADLAVFWLLPFYAIAPRAETLLVIQSVIIGSGAIAVYLFGANRLSKPTAMIFALAYLLYAPTVTSNFYDFHMQPIAGVLILYVIYFADVRKTVPFWIAFALALSCREDIPIGLAVLGMLLWFSGARPRLGRNMTILALAYFVLMRGFIMDLFGLTADDAVSSDDLDRVPVQLSLDPSRPARGSHRGALRRDSQLGMLWTAIDEGKPSGGFLRHQLRASNRKSSAPAQCASRAHFHSGTG